MTSYVYFLLTYKPKKTFIPGELCSEKPQLPSTFPFADVNPSSNNQFSRHNAFSPRLDLLQQNREIYCLVCQIQDYTSTSLRC